MNPFKKRVIFAFFIATIAIVGVTGPLFAEYRTYHSDQPSGQLIPQMIDAMGRAGFQFHVRRVYNEVKDGKQGFVFLLEPNRTYCEITFYSDTKGTLVRVFTQNGQDSQRFHLFFVKNLSMREVDVLPERPSPENQGGWPVP